MRRFCYAGVFSLCIIGSSMTFSADLDYAVKLKTNHFSTDQTKDAAAKSAALVDRHILVQFDGPIDESVKEQLAGAGVEILDYVPNYAFTAKLNRAVDQATIDTYGIRWLGHIEPVNKIAPLLADLGIAEWARREGGRAQFMVVLHRDENLQDWSDRFQSEFGAEIVGLEPLSNAIDLILPEQAYYRLADLDAVIWVKLVNPPQQVDNNLARINTQAEYMQQPPYNLSGAGVMAAVWDGGNADQAHPDLIGRIAIGSFSSPHYHATHVAGIIMGDGTASGGTYRGMAPAANLVSYLWWGTASQAQNEYAAAITLFNGKISNNSWGLGAGGDATQYWCENIMGNYLAENTTIDNIVRGGTSRPWVICWSAGNQRGSDPKYCGALGWTYNTVGGYANSKNIITVGAISSSTDDMLSFSSWGPCDDGRLKPDVVAPGCMYSTYYPGNGYLTLCGTSMSSPAVAGIATLLMQQAEASYPGRNLLSSTFKGLLINTAVDLGAPGPDYQFGHGKVQGLAAVSKIVAGDSSSFMESEISSGQAHLYDLTIPATDELRVTLVWDDPGATVLSGPVLVNDLDLVVIDPQSGEEYPWVLDGGSPGAFATRGVDHINNVESITIPNPYPGLWKARVTGFNVPAGPQKYSLIFSPDGIHTPGQFAALAVFDSDDAIIDPGQSTLVEFWAVNVGANADSVRVQIGDNQGWIDASVDSVVDLDPLDSAYFSVTATVPSEAMAWEEDSVLCTATSKTDPDIYTTGRVVVGAAGYYNMAVTGPENGSVNSPDTIQFDVWVKNLGNDYDDIKASCSDELGWNIYPQYIWTYDLTPGDSAMVTFSVAVPAEELDLDENTVMVNGVSLGGAIDQASFVLTVSNPYPPPALLSPDDDTYTQNRTHSFSWDGVGDSYSLYIFSDEAMTALERVYTGITPMTFTMPEVDSLDDGGYFWAVRKYVGADSSSLQRYPRKIVVDNLPPNSMTPAYPIGGIFVGQANFLFYFSGGKITTERAPEYGVIEMCQDSSFTADVRVFEPVSGSNYQMLETLEQGRWYWRMQRRDEAGNASPYSQKVNFILDSEAPPIPTLQKPVDGGTAGGTSVTFQWATDPPPVYEESAEYYHFQVSESPTFSSIDYSGYVYSTILNLSSGYFLEGSEYFWRVSALDSLGHVSSYQAEPASFTMLGFVCGDANANGAVNIADVSYLVAFLFGIPTGPPPIPFVAGDENGDGKVNVSDVSYLVAFLFGGGSPPICP